MGFSEKRAVLYWIEQGFYGNHMEFTPGMMECYFRSSHLQKDKMELEKMQRKSTEMVQGTVNWLRKCRPVCYLELDESTGALK